MIATRARALPFPSAEAVIKCQGTEVRPFPQAVFS